MKKRIIAAAAATVVGITGSAVAADLYVEAPVDTVVISEPGDWYVSLFGGVAWTSDLETAYDSDPDYNYEATVAPGFALGITVGTKVFEFLRVEAELSGTVNDITEVYESYDVETYDSNGSVSALYLLGNVWLDLETGSGFTPYIGGGVGGVAVSLDIYDDWTFRGAGFAYQLGAGVKVDVADNIALDLGYRYKAAPGLGIEEVGDEDEPWSDIDLSSHILQAGVTFKF